MSKEKRRVPRLRFPGFTGDWEQRKLSDITEIVMGQSPSSKNYTDNPNDNILVQGNADLKDGKVVPRLWTKEITKTIDKDGIILTVRAPVGDVARTDYKVVLGRGVAGIKGNDYIYQFLQKLQNNRYWVSLSSGSTFESINSNDIKDLIIDIPSIEEQTKISMLLNNVNSIITLHQRKLNHLILKKKSLLQKLFPKNGGHYPELRFPGFTDAWEQCKLSEVTICFDNLRVPVTASDRVPGKIPYYGANGIQDYVSGYTHSGEFVLIAEDGANDLNDYPIQYVNGAIWVNNHAHVIAGYKEKLENKFLSYSLKTVKMSTFIVGGGRSKLNLKALLEIPVSIPNHDEQCCIGKFIETIDKTITLHQRKLDHLQLQKKALLQQLFV